MCADKYVNAMKLTEESHYLNSRHSHHHNNHENHNHHHNQNHGHHQHQHHHHHDHSDDHSHAHQQHNNNHHNNHNHSHKHSDHDHHQTNSRSEIVFKNISVSVESDHKHRSSSSSSGSGSNSSDKLSQERRILRDISGYAKQGQILGVMGPSGSGKTTLLSTLSGRLKPSCGCITLNGHTINKQLRRKICYVLQQDIFFPSLTLRQTLIYTAQLRLPDSMSYREKMDHVEKIIDVLDLKHCQNTIIGDMMKRGLSGGEKKRANIACELLTNPSVLLIDEPTSGLDSCTAHSLMHTLKEYAVKERKIVVATVHQPSSQMFYMLDKLLLLSCSGRLAYFGDVNSVVPFFSNFGLEIAPHYNPADFIMEKVKNMSFQDRLINAAISNLRDSEEFAATTQTTTTTIEEDMMITANTTTNHCCSYKDNVAKSCCNDIGCNDDDPHRQLLWQTTDADTAAIDEHHTKEREDIKKSIELHVAVDDVDKKCVHHHNHHSRVYSKVMMSDDDSGRSSWSDTDRSSSTSTFSSNCSYRGDDDIRINILSSAMSSAASPAKSSDAKWPTSFWTQLKVLTQRNFFEARNRMLSKLNWIQTIALAIVAGLIWFQVARTENTLNDIRGWMFFTTTYWMLFALFGALISFPSEREVINKERSSGAYRLSAYYIAKMVGELPLTITLPTVFFFISYPMLGCYNASTFLSLWAFLILSTICAQSVGLFIGASCTDLEVSVTLSALYSLSTMLFAGYYSATMPTWMSWMRYCSMVYYAFLNMQMVEFFNGPPVLCSTKISRFNACQAVAALSTQNSTTSSLLAANNNSTLTVPYSELALYLDNMNEGSEPFPIWLNTLVLILFLVIFRLMGYFVLRCFRKLK